MAGIGTLAIAGALGATVLGIGAVAANPLGSEAAPDASANTALMQDFEAPAGMHGPFHGRGMEHHEQVAEALGVSVEDLNAAIQAVRDTVEKPEPPLTPEQRLALRDELAAALGDELGLSQEAVQAAYDSVFEANLQAKVDEGKITEDEANEIREARDSGTLIDLIRERHDERVGERLDMAVENGVLTQEQRDALQAELDAGDREGFQELLRQYREESGTFFGRGLRRGGRGFPGGIGGFPGGGPIGDGGGTIF